MHCFSCDRLLPYDTPRDPKLNRFYCETCREKIDDLVFEKERQDTPDDDLGFVKDYDEINYDEIEDILKDRE